MWTWQCGKPHFAQQGHRGRGRVTTEALGFKRFYDRHSDLINHIDIPAPDLANRPTDQPTNEC
jgi:hypothetical protein